MIPPELGTAARADTTGIGRFSTILALGGQPALTSGGISDPWFGLKFRWDFPEAKFPLILGYMLMGGLTPSFNKPIDPALPNGPMNDEMWGRLAPTARLVGEPTVATSQTIFGVIGGTMDYNMEPGKQVYVTILPAYDITPGAEVVGTHAEILGIHLAQLPPEGAYPFIDPPPLDPWDRITGLVPVTP